MEVFYPVVFENSYGEERIIGEAKEKKEALKIINQFLEDHNFKSYYVRSWEVNGRTKFDVGSHSEFFYWGESKTKKIQINITVSKSSNGYVAQYDDVNIGMGNTEAEAVSNLLMGLGDHNSKFFHRLKDKRFIL